MAQGTAGDATGGGSDAGEGPSHGARAGTPGDPDGAGASACSSGNCAAGRASTSGGQGGQSGAEEAATGGETAAGGAGPAAGGAWSGGAAGGGAGAAGDEAGATAGGAVWPPPIPDAPSGLAYRAWGCCKPSCGWTATVATGNPVMSCSKDDVSLGSDYDAKNACEPGGVAYMCTSFAPWATSDTLAYGFVASSAWDATCGACYELEFTGGAGTFNKVDPGLLVGKRMVVQVVDMYPDTGFTFTLFVPGGGVGSVNACGAEWGTSDLGNQYGGYLTSCAGDVACYEEKCQSVFADNPDLEAACLWYPDWLAGVDQPAVRYSPITCPDVLTERSGRLGPDGS